MRFSPGQWAGTHLVLRPADLDALALLGGPPPDAGGVESLIGAGFSMLLGMRLPGPGTNWLKQELHFETVPPVGATLVLRVDVTRLRPEKRLVDLACHCATEDGRTICRGRALVLVPDLGD